MNLGYTTKAEAIAAGCTHHGSYYGIPLWMGDVDSDCPLVFAKWAPLEWLMMGFTYIECLLWPLVHDPDAPLGFLFKIKGPIALP